MAWKKPKIVEICVGLEINSDAQEAMYNLFKAGQKVTDTEAEIYAVFWRKTIVWALSIQDKNSAQTAYQALEKIAAQHPDLEVSLSNWKMQMESF